MKRVSRWLVVAAVVGTARDLSARPARAPLPQQLDAPEINVEPPRIFLKTAMPAAPATGRRVISVAAGGNLQQALDAAQPGDVIELAKGAVFSGNFTLRNKNTASDAWIVIRPANHANLPAEGTRMTPAVAQRLALPRIETPNAEDPIKTARGAHHYRLVALDVGIAAARNQAWTAITLGDDNRTLADIPHDLVLDRMYVHGNATATLRRCVVINSASTAIIDSWLSDCHEKGSDSQAILGYNGPGPFKIVNNYLEGAGENVMFGGADPSIVGMVPSDIEIRRNHFYKPLAWKGKWTIKNHLELKNAQRVLIEGNVMENSWWDGQAGASLLVKSTNQSGKCQWCVSRDVNIRLNLIRNVGVGIAFTGMDGGPVTTTARNISMTDNVISRINLPPFEGDGFAMILSGLTSVVIAHNTIVEAKTAMVLGGVNQDFSFHDNILASIKYGVIADGMTVKAAIATHLPGSRFIRNALVVPDAGVDYPQGNYFPPSLRAIGFEDLAGENYRLVRISKYEKAGTGGKDIGADVVALDAAIAGVRVP